MKIRLTKRFVIEALRKEPLDGLRVRGFIERYDADGRPLRIDNPQCVSCAVGTVIKRAVSPRTMALRVQNRVIEPLCAVGGFDWIGAHSDAAGLVRAGEPWRALSIVYESVAGASGANKARGRAEAIRFVEKHFPLHVELDIDGIKPRLVRGVSIVKTKRAGR